MFQAVCASLWDRELVIVPEAICMSGLSEIVGNFPLCWEPVSEVRGLEGSSGKVTARLPTPGAEPWQARGS